MKLLDDLRILEEIYENDINECVKRLRQDKRRLKEIKQEIKKMRKSD